MPPSTETADDAVCCTPAGCAPLPLNRILRSLDGHSVTTLTRREEEEDKNTGWLAGTRGNGPRRLTSEEEGQQEWYDDSRARDRHALLLGKAPVPFRVGCEVFGQAAKWGGEAEMINQAKVRVAKEIEGG